MKQRFEHIHASTFWEVEELQKEGWELVGVVPIQVTEPELRAGRAKAGQAWFYLKRPVD